ncbi:BA75_05123T0 [Komagataella pastoris]|uniref:BA75_05123T0 n=1 Tax=Komagataella pastoris TaxID=4922 RepID=A0A1B2JHT8_PICPA|nr:BA75_05123T0 [Komagataella pastoris]
MGKNVIKHGGKSGILPPAREIFKQPIKPIAIKKNPNTGYASNIPHPRGSTREAIVPKVVTIEEKISKTAPEPKKIYSNAELSKLSADQQWKIKNSKLRRDYLKESYYQEEKNLEHKEKIQHLKESKAKEEAAAASHYEVSEAFRLTLPSMEQFLEGPIVRQRTKEEKRLLQLKREHNRLQRELAIKEQKASDLLRLCSSAKNFIVTEEELERKVEELYRTGPKAYFNGSNMNSFEDQQALDIEKTVQEKLFGTVNEGPGISTIEDILSGETEKLKNAVEEKVKQNDK